MVAWHRCQGPASGTARGASFCYTYRTTCTRRACARARSPSRPPSNPPNLPERLDETFPAEPRDPHYLPGRTSRSPLPVERPLGPARAFSFRIVRSGGCRRRNRTGAPRLGVRIVMFSSVVRPSLGLWCFGVWCFGVLVFWCFGVLGLVLVFWCFWDLHAQQWPGRLTEGLSALW